MYNKYYFFKQPEYGIPFILSIKLGSTTDEVGVVEKSGTFNASLSSTRAISCFPSAENIFK